MIYSFNISTTVSHAQKKTTSDTIIGSYIPPGLRDIQLVSDLNELVLLTYIERVHTNTQFHKRIVKSTNTIAHKYCSSNKVRIIQRKFKMWLYYINHREFIYFTILYPANLICTTIQLIRHELYFNHMKVTSSCAMH